VILLKLISWPYCRKHVLRTTLMTTGIVLGVAVFVGMHTANQSVVFAFYRTVDRIAGRTQLQVTAGETGFDEEVLDRVRSSPSVRVAVPVIEAVVDSGIPGEGNLLILGVDMTGDRSLREYDLESGDEAVVDDPLVFLAQPDSIILTRDFAERNHIHSGSRIRLGTMLGPREFVVRGIMRSSGLASAFGGNLGIMDIYATQQMFGRGRSFDRIDLAVALDRSIAPAQTELRALLGPGFQVEPPSSRGQQFEAMTAAYSMMMSISSVLSVFIGMFIIYNSFAIAVAERRAEIGILRGLGATRSQIRWLFLGESAVAGLIGAAGGVMFGLLIARGIATSIGKFIADVYGVAERANEIAYTPSLLFTAVALGVATSLVAALIPARQAARVDPIYALQKGRYQVLSADESRARVAIAGVFGLVSLLCLWTAQSRAVFYLGFVLCVAAALLLCPLMSLVLVRAIRPVMKWLLPVEGTLAADSLIQAPRRMSASVAALMLSVALVIGFAGIALASHNSIVVWMDGALNPDLFVMPSQDIAIQTLRFPEAMQGELTAVNGVKRVQPVRNARIVFRRTPVMIVATDVVTLSETSPRSPVEGDGDRMYPLTAAGRGVIVSENLAELQGLHAGDVVDIPAPYGTLRLPIVGIVVDYSDQQGTILVDRSVFRKYWKDDSVNAFRVYLTAGANVLEVRRRMLERFAGKRQVFVLTNAELKAHILRVTNQWFGLTFVQIAIAVLVAILGIVNTLTVSISDRRREFGVLQAVGAIRGQIRRTIWMEALSIGTLGLVLGCLLGALNLYYILEIVQRDITGMRFDYVFPAPIAMALVPAILGAAFLAAVWPAESAVRASLVQALEYE